MKRWIPNSLYAAKPWALVVAGAALVVGSMAWSIVADQWNDLRGALCGLGVVMSVGGGVILQLRQDYRAQSKWRRERRR
jgi:predicted MFS family arabinose efflux permease